MTDSGAAKLILRDGELQPEGGWLGPSTPRLIAPPPKDRGLVFRSMSLVAKAFGRTEMPDIFSVFHINARLFWAWLYFASKLMPGGRLPAKVREKIILRTAWNCRSRYEWGQHVDIALTVGVTDEEIIRVSHGPEAFTDSNERALMTACDEMVRSQFISDQTWKTLSERYKEKMLIEIVILIGHYIMVAGFLNSGGLKLEPSIEKKLAAFHQRISS
ncbi:carboxymuconolactone decarboxylase family protein [Stenotrophobium rhamnosiphilum]|uniref:Carboxymuconolactone decarboxylase family protein n=1 Tax=Stenotrophobium rhamnosiphilum TaxID=2029166 RepID=A0A2T5MB90_9GAMM|nr:carboxymuconolactone decarboxylase family protein [Stenotrophobium rhamnosiphilum]PTU28248.1 carboxymuconolactone decarboxylase family protein [Stenotrophobium rhamnosiphilum]